MNAYAQARNRYQDDGLKMTSPQRLVVLLYQRLLRDLRDADTAIQGRRVEDAHNALIHAQDIVLEFHLALDTEGFEGGERLADIYVYLTDRLVDANRAKDRGIIAECISMVEPLAEAFETVAQIPTSSDLTTTPA